MAQPQLAPAWKPGQSGNPGGRPKGLARRAREAVPDLDLIEFQKAVLYVDEELLAKWDIDRKEVRLVDRQTAHTWLTERGHGKAAPNPVVEDDDPLERKVDEERDDLIRKLAPVVDIGSAGRGTNGNAKASQNGKADLGAAS